MKTEVLFLITLVTACVPPEDAPPGVPEPIGPELLSFTAQTDVFQCKEGHIYRAERTIQLQCFSTTRNAFSWENRGTLSVEGAAALDAALAAADFDNTEPAPDNGLCEGNPDAHLASRTLWVGERSFTYSPSCPTMGIVELHEVATILIEDITECTELGTELDLLESVEPGCRPY